MKEFPIGLLKRQMYQQGQFNLSDISDGYICKQNQLEDDNKWYYDATLIGGSNHSCEVTNNTKTQKMSIWSINHYLGLNRNIDIIESGIEALSKYGTGSGTSAMSGGHCELHKEIQNRFSEIFNKEETLLYPTGFTANLGAISGLMGGSASHNLIIIDQECHASIIDGCKLSGAKFIRFKHNDVNDLRIKLERYKDKFTNIMVAIESVYSMSGDFAPMKEIVDVKNQYPFILFVDESHSFGLYGDNGFGLSHELGVLNDVDVIMTTLSKSCASIGGIVSTSSKYCSLLRWSTSYIYQASIPPHNAIIVLESLKRIAEGKELDVLKEKVSYFRRMLLDGDFKITGHGAIVPVYIDDDKLKIFERELFEKGIYTVAIQYPIVALGEARFRFIVNASHTYEEIDNLVEVLSDIRSKVCY